MEVLPQALLTEIVKRITRTGDLNSLSLVSKQLYNIDAEQRGAIRVGCGLCPAAHALEALCRRFTNLWKVEISYSSWTPAHGDQIDSQGLKMLSSCCPSLSDLTLSYCAYIDDIGIGYVAFCRKLMALRLKSLTKISESGLLMVAFGCKNLSSLHLVDCKGIVGSADWLKYLGSEGSLEELVVKKCDKISQYDLLRFGPGWMRIKKFEFCASRHYNIFEPHDPSYVANYKYGYDISCERLKELCLMRIVTEQDIGLRCLLKKCKALEKLSLHFVLGLNDSDIITLAQNCSKLRSLSLQLEPVFCEEPEGRIFRTPLTDISLKSLALGCRMLQVVELIFFACEPTYPEIGFTQEGLVMFLQSCPIRDLVLCGANIFDDEGMKALSSIQFLETLELMDCIEVTDSGMRVLARSPSLRNLTLRQSDGFTDVGVGEVVRSRKLDSLLVEGCSGVSLEAVQGAAKSVHYEAECRGYAQLGRTPL